VCAVDIDGVAIDVAGSSLAVRALVQRMLGGPEELAAPRPLGAFEQSLWSLLVAAALEDLGIAALVRPLGRAPQSSVASRVLLDVTIGIGSAIGGTIALAIELRVPHTLATRSPRLPRTLAEGSWIDRVHFELPIVAGRCAIHREDLARLAVRSLVTLERPADGAGLELDLFGVALPLSGERVTGYVPRDMSLPDTAHVELTVALGTKQLSLRQITELAVGQIVQLGRPLGGPFELRAEGRVLGRGELVDVDGELAVRIVSLGD
jgi:flagellar motor switch/type III secretory pathway protein FliN